MFSILGRFIAYLLLLAFLIYCVAFSLTNSMVLEINYLFGTKEIALPLLLIVALVIGFLLGLLGMLGKLLCLRSRNSHLNKELKVLEKELVKINTSPSDDH